MPSSPQFRTYTNVRLLENSLSNTLVCGAGPSCHPKNRFDAGTKVANRCLLLQPLPAVAPHLEVENSGATMVPAGWLRHNAGSQLIAPGRLPEMAAKPGKLAAIRGEWVDLEACAGPHCTGCPV